MDDSLVEQAFDLHLLLSPWIEALIKNFSFKDEFLIFCAAQSESSDPIISWSQLKSFFDSNKWNWNTFILSNLQTILFEHGFLLSCNINRENIPITDGSQLLVTLQAFSSSKAVFDNEMLSDLRKKSFPLIKEQKSSSQQIEDAVSTTVQNDFPYMPKKEHISPSIIIFSNDLKNFYNKVTVQSFEKHFRNRFSLLEQIVIDSHQDDKNRPKYPKTSKEIELNERIFITGLVTQTDLSNTQLYSTKLQLENFSLNCSVIVSISINQQSKIPLGIVLGIIGKVTDIENQAHGKVIVVISAENWFYPGINPPSKKPIPKTTNESWVVIIGSLNFANSQHTRKMLSQFTKWLQRTHENFRISYCIFIGGILSSHDFDSYTNSGFDFTDEDLSPTSKYNSFNQNIEKIPANIQIFIVPSPFDITNQFLPQPQVKINYHSSKKNIFYLQNPNIVTLEDKNLILYNPYQFYSVELFQNQPEKFGIELLNLRHLCPIWEQSQKVFYPYSYDSLIIPEDIDFFVFTHPAQFVLSNYKNISIFGVGPNTDDSLNEFKVVLFNLHSQERKIMTIPL